jgi:hypothetical protein
MICSFVRSFVRSFVLFSNKQNVTVSFFGFVFMNITKMSMLLKEINIKNYPYHLLDLKNVLFFWDALPWQLILL